MILALTAGLGPNTLPAFAASKPEQKAASTATPIQHLVVIFQENVSFDHYFATYPNAANPSGEPRFKAFPGTPTVNGLSSALLTNNPNLNPANGAGASNPFRAWTAPKPSLPTRTMITPPSSVHSTLA